MNDDVTLKAIELAHKILQNKIIDKEGNLAVNDEFFKGLDCILTKLQETRAIAEALR